MKLYQLNHDEEYYQDYRDRKIEEVNCSVADDDTKRLWRLEINYINDILSVIRKYKKEITKL